MEFYCHYPVFSVGAVRRSEKQLTISIHQNKLGVYVVGMRGTTIEFGIERENVTMVSETFGNYTTAKTYLDRLRDANCYYADTGKPQIPTMEGLC